MAEAGPPAAGMGTRVAYARPGCRCRGTGPVTVTVRTDDLTAGVMNRSLRVC